MRIPPYAERFSAVARRFVIALVVSSIVAFSALFHGISESLAGDRELMLAFLILVRF